MNITVCLCYPNWYTSDGTRYKAIQVSKQDDEIKAQFNQDYLDDLPEKYVWKIITHSKCVYKSNKDFRNEFIIVEN